MFKSENFSAIIFFVKKLALKIMWWYIINLPPRRGSEIKKQVKKLLTFESANDTIRKLLQESSNNEVP